MRKVLQNYNLENSYQLKDILSNNFSYYEQKIEFQQRINKNDEIRRVIVNDLFWNGS